MDPEQSQKSTKKGEEGPRKRLVKGEAFHGSVSSAAAYPSTSAPLQGSAVPDVASQQHFAREESQEKAGQAQPKPPTFEHPSHVAQLQQLPLSPAYMAPRKQEHVLEGPTWQLVDPPRAVPSSSFPSSGPHASHSRVIPSHSSVVPEEDMPSVQKLYVPRAPQVSVKPSEEGHKKEKKPQKPGKYICQYCSRPCAKPSVLQKHIRSHTGERPYPCVPCGFSFKTKSNLYKHRKSHAHRIKAGLSSGAGAELYPSSLEMEKMAGEEFEEPTEGESTDSEEETRTTPGHLAELSPRQKQTMLYGAGSQGSSQESSSFSHSSMSQSLDDTSQFVEPATEHVQSHKSEETHTIKQKLALRLSERKKVIEEQAFLSPGSKGSTESGYFSRSESAEQQISPPNTNVKSYAEIIFGKCGRIGQRTAMLAAAATQEFPQVSAEEKPSTVPLSVPRTQVIEHITKLITINEAVVDTSEIDSVKPRRSSLSRRSSIESPKTGAYREPFQLEIKPGSGSQLELSKSSTSHAEKMKPEQSLLSLQQSHSATETVPLLRSHSVPSAACTMSSPHTFRGSYSFDDHITESEVLSRSQVSSHPRMLKRQPAIELPLGMEYSSEEVSTASKESLLKPTEEPESKESELTKKLKKGTKVKGFMYECNVCGARYKKRDNYEAHKKYYCSELQISKPHSSSSHTSLEAEKGFMESDPWPQMMHYKLGTSLELTPLRKRRKEKSLGDDEDPPAFELTETSSSSSGRATQFSGLKSTDVALNLLPQSIKSPADPSQSMPLSDVSASFHSRSAKPSFSTESKERRTTSKEISVIQHTSSFEKSESTEQLSGLEGEEKLLLPYVSQPPAQHARPSHSLQPKLVRQPNIQVPEILVTEEPDRPEMEPEPPPKEPEKTEEFQWPQRSQSLSQLPAEKLPPKKKRLRLAEMAQSSGESSFESIRSPSQESSISHTSSRSTSFEREEAVSQPPEAHAKLLGIGPHMLMVPSHHHHHHSREMRRSASEQTPNVSHSSPMSETRSKSFDYGSLSSSPAPASHLPTTSTAAPPPQERRKCFLVRQASLTRHPEHEPDPVPKGAAEMEDVRPSSRKSPAADLPHQQLPPSSSSSSSHRGYPADQGQPKDCSESTYSHPYTEALQVFHHPAPQLTLHEKQYMTPQISFLPFPHLLPQPGQSIELFSTQAMADIFAAQYSIPQIPHSVFQSPALPLQDALLHPGQFHIAPPLMSHPADVALRQSPSLFPIHYPGSPPLPSAFFLPLQSQLALQLPSEIGAHLPQLKSSLSPPIRSPSFSPSINYSSESQLHILTRPNSPSATVSISQLVVPACAEPVVSLVVPVRIQTNMPSYGSAMYTTLSQILVTQSHCSASSIILPKFDDYQAKGTLVCTANVHGIGLDLAQMITEEQKSLFQTPYLRLPLSLSERKSYIPLGSASESILDFDGSPSTVGGSKRMLSPAGSLELTMETQQQKRVKEEEFSEMEEKLKIVMTASTATEGKECSQGRTKAESSPDLSPQASELQEESGSLPPDLPQSEASSLEVHEGYEELVVKELQSKDSAQMVKKEDSKDPVEPPAANPPSAVVSSEAAQSSKKSQEGRDVKKGLQFPSLHTTTNVSWCYLNYIKPNHIQQVDRRSSVYSSWCVSLYNPNLPGISTKVALSLLHSKQKVNKETYTMATAPRPEAGRLVLASSRNPKMSEVHQPSPLPSEVQKDVMRTDKEEDKRGKGEDDIPISKRVEPARIKIFEGGYKSNEEYVYVRGRGRGKYVCEECGIRCKKPSMLKKHIRTHTDVRPYVCKYCNFAFKTKGNLTKHMKSKAHSKKCQEMGVLVSSLVELEAEEEGTSNSTPHCSASKYYKVHIHPDVNNQKRKQRTDLWNSSVTKKQGKVLSYWCFSPGYSMHELVRQGVRTIILTSGTLSPISSFTMEMQIPFPVCLENPHVIEKHQIWGGIIPKGPDGGMLSSTFEKRFSEECLSSLGKTIGNLVRIIPHGLLVFFPSYPVMDKSLEFWREHDFMKKIEAVKPVFVEARNKGAFSEAIDAYYKKIACPESNGAIFFAVCRGKASEGLDFADRTGRAVIITGLPFPPRMDPRVILKMQFLDEMRAKSVGGQCLSGNRWYRQQASRAVNQAIGRVIRHRLDYGAIFLCDHRFVSTDLRAQLSSWVQPYIKVYEKFGHVIREVSHFFRMAQQCMPIPMPGLPSCSAAEEDGDSSSSTSQEQLASGRKASHFDNHVPSLKRKRMENRTASLCVEYDQGPTSSRRQPVGLLDALELNERKSGEADEEDGLPGEETAKRLSTLSLQYEKRLLDEQKGNKKKLKIISHLQVPDPSEPKKARAASFIAVVKRSLSQLNFDSFSRALQQYKNTNDFDAMLSQMSALFLEDQKKHILLREFYQFVRPQHKKQFDEACCSLTGVGCGYKPEHSLLQDERLLLAKKAGKQCEKTVALLENSSGQLDSEQHLNRGGSHLMSGPGATGGSCADKTDEPPRNPPSTLRETQSQIIRSAYLNDLRTALDKSSFDQFFSALSAYKRTDDCDALVPVVVALTTEKPEHLHLLQRFSMFVRPHHKNQFKQMCKELTGMNCPCESKEVFLPAQKGLGLGATVEESGIQDKAASAIPGSYGSKEGETLQRTASPASDLETQKTEGGPSSSRAPTISDSLPISAVGGKDVERGADGEQKEKEKEILQGGFLCVKCKSDGGVPLKCQLCAFTCCKTCWESLLKVAKKCPRCQAETKRRHLALSYWPDPQ